MIVLLFLIALVAPVRHDAGFLGGTGTDYAIPEAAARFAAETGAPLPPGIEITHHHEGGFQDGYAQIGFAATESGLHELLALLDADEQEDTAGASMPPNLAQLDWWQDGALVAPATRNASFGHYSAAWIHFGRDAADPGRWRIYLLAIET